MNLSTKHVGNISLAHAISYFADSGYYIFLPVGDNGGAIDLAVSQDGLNLLRVQCKYTSRRHTSMMKRYPDSPVWDVSLRSTGRLKEEGRYVTDATYTKDSFDILFVSTPSGDYLIRWPEYCEEQGKTPDRILLGKNNEKFKLVDSSMSQSQ